MEKKTLLPTEVSSGHELISYSVPTLHSNSNLSFVQKGYLDKKIIGRELHKI